MESKYEKVFNYETKDWEEIPQHLINEGAARITKELKQTTKPKFQKVYVIESILDGGFWDDCEKRFRGYLFATKYNYASPNHLEEAVKQAPSKITEVYEEII